MVKPPLELLELPQVNPQVLDLEKNHSPLIEQPGDWIESGFAATPATGISRAAEESQR
jgi:hypothetical protein